jgi:beta-N-acetylhexosaminidase
MSNQVSLLLESLSPEQAVAQCLMPSLHPAKYDESEDYRNQCSQLIELGVGGFCVFQGDIERTALILAELQAQADIPLLFSADYEHGLPMRLEGGTDFPHAMALARGGSTTQTNLVARAIAKEMKAIGVHWNFAPVCDINSNKLNPIINTRAFGESIGEVVPHSSAFLEGLQEEQVIACAKHFPGHGDTSVDSHISMPILNHTRERLSSLELVPFLNAIKRGVKSVMMAHIAVPSFEDANTPASLSKVLVTDVLRTYMKFEGIIVTDALDMHAISSQYSSSESSVKALQAGCDIALIPTNPMEALTAMKEAILSGSLNDIQIMDSVRRILELKDWCGLLSKRARPIEPISLEQHGTLALKAAISSVRILGDLDVQERILPLEQYEHISAFAILQNDVMDTASEFFHFLSQVYEKNTDIAYINDSITEDEIKEYITGTEFGECVVFAVFARAQSYSGTVQLSEKLNNAAKRIADGRPVIAVLFGNPYLAETFPADVFIQCFSDSKPSLGSACLAMTNKSLNI